MSCNKTILELKNICRKLPEINIINDISFIFKTGNIYSIIGPSGAGKSSLLRLINRLDEPTGGNIFFDGNDYTQYQPCELRKRIGYLFQTPYLFEGSVKNNIRYGNQSISDEKIKELAEQTQISEKLLNSDSAKLSVGEKQRVALARMLALNPEVILLDEPTSALDPANTATIEKLIKQIAERCEATFLFVSHNPEQALRMGGQALLLVYGQLIEYGPAEQIINNPQSDAGKLYQRKELQ